MRKILLCLSLLINTAVIFAQNTEPEGKDATIHIKKIADFTVTGNGSSEAWKTAEWVRLTPQEEGISGYETKVKILYSETGLYFLYSCQDEKLTATMHDDNMNLWEEDVVELFLWPAEDFPVYFEYEISPLDFELPIIVPNYKGKFLGWLPWNYAGDKRVIHATSVTGGQKKSGSQLTSWTAEFFIPYKLLSPLPNVPPSPGTKWRANMYRIDYDLKAIHFSWQKTNRTFHDYNSFGTFVFE
jgi:hypothetical protein